MIKRTIIRNGQTEIFDVFPIEDRYVELKAALDKMINRALPPIDLDLKQILIEWRKIL